MVVTNQAQIAEQIKMLREYGQEAKYQHRQKGFNSRLDNIQAAVLRVKLKWLEEWNQTRRRNVYLYNRSLSVEEEGIANVVTPFERNEVEHVYHLYVIKTKERDRLKEWLANKGISTGIHYPIPIHLQRAYKDLGYKKGDFPVAETCAKEILSLPMFPELTGEQIEYISESIKSFCRQEVEDIRAP
ncbi:dTDP-3-amino-3,4,6-trideoxy-alpha-D-glucose transaminase [subsurface metagenome]